MELVMQQANDKTFAFSFQYRAVIFQNGQVRNADLNVRVFLNVFLQVLIVSNDLDFISLY